jgi:ParB-like chromosome segregation protein Spo0J
MKITQKKVDSLIPYINNSRTHSDEQVAQIAASIKEFGWTNPILVDGANGIIAGHGRLLAARKLGYKEVPTIELKDLTETQKKAYIIADNKLALNAGWDNELLMIELEGILADGFELELMGFDPSELDNNSIDYDILDDEDLDGTMSDMANGVRKAIQIEFEPEDYDRAFALVKFWREKGLYVGDFLINKLEAEKAKL